jgi:hypothetical protein
LALQPLLLLRRRLAGGSWRRAVQAEGERWRLVDPAPPSSRLDDGGGHSCDPEQKPGRSDGDGGAPARGDCTIRPQRLSSGRAAHVTSQRLGGFDDVGLARTTAARRAGSGPRA